MTDHKAEAEQALRTLIHDYNEMHAKLTRMVAAGEGVGADELVATFLPMVAIAGSAQAHATLAVAEQQRIANLIAYTQAEGGPYKFINWTDGANEKALTLIREGLAL